MNCITARILRPLLAVGASLMWLGTVACGPAAIGSALASGGGGGGTGPGVPVRPSTLTVQATTPTAAQLLWQDDSEIETGFRVERSTGGVFELVATVPPNTIRYLDAALAPATDYTYRVQSFNDVGFSPYSNVAQVQTPNEPPPAAPTQLQAISASTSEIDLSWTNNTDGTGSIRIERTHSTTFTLLATVDGSATSFRDTGLLPATTFSYRLQAIRGGQLSEFSNVSMATTSSTSPPTLSAATVMSAGATPVAGETLVLFLTNDSVLVPGALIDEQDLTITAGTLGAVTVQPSLINPRLISVTLGVGVDLTPGVSTLTFAPGNDAVRGASGAFAEPGPPRELSRGDGDQPSIDNLTLNAIDGLLNGTGPAGGTLQVPTTGFTIDVRHSDPSSAISPPATTITASVPVFAGSELIPPGQSFTSFLTFTGSPTETNFAVPPTTRFSDGPVAITVFVRDVTGMTSAPQTFNFLCKTATDELRPFETTDNPLQLWYLDMTRDLESYTFAGPGNPVEIVAAANARPDIEDLWQIMGLFGGAPSINDVVRTRLITRMLQELSDLYGDVNIAFTTTSPGTFPSGTASVPYSQFGYSQICIGSSSSFDPQGRIGLALFDPNNASQEDNCLSDFQGTIRLGVFVYPVVNQGYGQPISAPFRTIFDPFAPAGGTPIGDDINDDSRLSGSTQDARASAIDQAISSMARVMAVLVANTCGNSMGLVKDSAMPTGLYGGDATNFPGSPPGFINTDSLFPAGATNLMSGSLSFAAMLNPATGFNSLNLAYLRERVLTDL